MLKIATLIYNTQDLADKMIEQVPSVIVIDNGSNPPIRNAHIRLDKNYFWTGGWNRALRLLEGDYVWMLNSDVDMVSEEMGQELYRLAQGIEKLGVISPAYDSVHRHMWPKPFSTLRKTQWVDWSAGLVSRKAWDDVGEFDERFSGYGGDTDWSYRAYLKGYNFYIADKLHFHHTGSVTLHRERLYKEWFVDIHNPNNKLVASLIESKWGTAWPFPSVQSL